ncbi:MAG: hypothetical protein H6Q74_2771 [Firmicutes bacterium]|nr:hypothetical protein [Bacillota bacterium]
MQGITEYDHNGVQVLRVHYSADPAKDNPEWVAEQKKGTTTAAWEQEYEINFNYFSGRPWYPEFRRDFHVAKDPIRPVAGRPIVRGWDYGLTPATCFCQTTAKGQMVILYPELQSTDCGILAHGQVVKAEAVSYFPGYEFSDYGDPAGNQRSQNDERTANDLLQSEYGIVVLPGPVAAMARWEAVRKKLTSLTPDGQPMLLIDPRCTWIIGGFTGGYHRKEVAGVLLEEPDKNEYSHMMDAVGYVAASIFNVAKKPWRHLVGARL